MALVVALSAGSSAAATMLGPWQPLFEGIDHSVSTNFPDANTLPHLMVVHTMRVDLTAPGLRLFPSPPITNFVPNLRETSGMTVTDFLRTNHLQVAVNANFFDPGTYTLPIGTPMTVDGLSISEGVVVSQQSTSANSAVIAFDLLNRPTFIATNWPATDNSGFQTAVAGTYPVLIGGVNVARNYLALGGSIHRTQPRTAFGLSADRRHLFLMTIDGRQGDEDYSEGAYDYETAEMMRRLGADDAVNMDGGGSTTLVVEDTTGFPLRLNIPSAVADSGRERTVGSHFGVYARPLQGFISSLTVVPDDRSAVISWTTVEPATSQVRYGPTTDLALSTAIDTTLTTGHSVALPELLPNTGYYFRVLSATDLEQHSSSNRYFVTTNYITTNLIFGLEKHWKFTTANVEAMNWTTPAYDDAAWQGEGPGLLWVDVRPTGPNVNVTPRVTELPANPANFGFPFHTYYFRTRFHLSSFASGDSLRFSGFVDDGAVFHLNGVEVHRLRMPADVVGNLTLAADFPCAGDSTCPDGFELAVAGLPGLLIGENVLSAEVHNYDARSADIIFGVALEQIVPVVRAPVLHLSSTSNLITLTWDRPGFILQSSETPNGPWLDASTTEGTTLSTPPSDQVRFFRLRQR